VKGVGPDSRIGIAAGLDAIVLSADEVLIQFGSRSHPSELLRDGDLSGAMGIIFSRLNERDATIGELLAELKEADRAGASALIADLLERGILADARWRAVDQYVRYTFEGDAPSDTARVSIVGAGPLGARVAHSLLRQNGVRLLLLDDRPSDVVWQAFMPAGLRDTALGTRADVAACAQLEGAEYLESSLDAAGIEAAVDASNLTILALEQVDLRTAHLVNRSSVRSKKPWLHLVIDGNVGIVGPLFQPPDTACYNDYRTLVAAAAPHPLMARKQREYLARRGAGSFFAGLPAYADIVAGHAAVAATHFLLRRTCFAVGRVMTVDFEQMEIDMEDVFRLPRCPVCGAQKSVSRPALPAR
jgi:bacteriocin biosynthesis cyclodehydratase domain-containing protein